MNKLTKIVLTVTVSGLTFLGATAPSMAVTPGQLNQAVTPLPSQATGTTPTPVTDHHHRFFVSTNTTQPASATYTDSIGRCHPDNLGDCNGGLVAPAPVSSNDSNDPSLFGSNNSNDPGLFGKVPDAATTHWCGLTSTIGTTAPNHLNDFGLVLA